MTLGVRIKLDTRKLDDISRHLGQDRDGVVRTVAFDVETEMKASIGSAGSPGPPGGPPGVVTGNLKSNIITRKIRTALYWVESQMDYAESLEFGTSKMAARPFVVPAVNKAKDRFEILWKGIFK